MVLYWTLLGPLNGPYDLWEKYRNFRENFRISILDILWPFNHVRTLIWSLSNSTKAQGTLLDLHGPPNIPQNGPCEDNFRAPLVKKGPAGSDHGPKLSIFLDRSQDNGQTWIYSHVWGQSDIPFRSNRDFPTEEDDCAPPALIRVKRTTFIFWLGSCDNVQTEIFIWEPKLRK